MKSGLSQSKIAPREGPGVNCCFLDKPALLWTNSATSGAAICALMSTRGLVHLRQRFVRRSHGRKRPRPIKAGASWHSGIGGYSALPALHQLRRDCRAEHPSVALPTSWVLFICAKNLLVEAMAPTGHGTKTFEPDQSFEPGARNRRPKGREKLKVEG
jgi:hypothetical protein